MSSGNDRLDTPRSARRARALRLVETGDTARDPQRRGPTSSTLSTGEFTVCGRSTAYGRRVSGAMENRAAVFTSQPQAIEVYQAGTWWAGELLGWRHEADGSCQVWVRVVLGGIEETAWTDLATLRLPERHLSVATPAPQRGPATQEMSVARHPSGRRARSAEVEAPATGGLRAVRDLSAVPDLPSAGGRRTADETAQFASVGRRRAPEAAAAPAVGRRRAPDNAVASAPTATPVPPPGRHRAPADPGRHGTGDTGLVPQVPQAGQPPQPPQAAKAPQAAQSPRAARLEKDAARPRGEWTAPAGMEAELLTRPMRLSDHMQSRRPRPGGSRSV